MIITTVGIKMKVRIRIGIIIKKRIMRAKIRNNTMMMKKSMINIRNNSNFYDTKNNEEKYWKKIFHKNVITLNYSIIKIIAII